MTTSSRASAAEGAIIAGPELSMDQSWVSLQPSRRMALSFDLVLDRETASGALQAMLHGILFHRLFGIVTPYVRECLDVSFPAVRDAETENLVYETVDGFVRGLQAVRQGRKEGQLEILFTEEQIIKGTWLTPDRKEDVPWETWVINVTLEQPQNERDREYLQETLSATLKQAVMTMVTYSASDRGRIVVPPISTMDSVSPFPIHIVQRIQGTIVQKR